MQPGVCSLLEVFHDCINYKNFILQLNGNFPAQVWEFDQAHQRWLPVAELTLTAEKGDEVYAVAWAQNIGR